MIFRYRCALYNTICSVLLLKALKVLNVLEGSANQRVKSEQWRHKSADNLYSTIIQATLFSSIPLWLMDAFESFHSESIFFSPLMAILIGNPPYQTCMIPSKTESFFEVVRFFRFVCLFFELRYTIDKSKNTPRDHFKYTQLKFN